MEVCLRFPTEEIPESALLNRPASRRARPEGHLRVSLEIKRCLVTGLPIEDVFVSDGEAPPGTGATGMGCPPPKVTS